MEVKRVTDSTYKSASDNLVASKHRLSCREVVSGSNAHEAAGDNAVRRGSALEPDAQSRASYLHLSLN
jgi:hypothetical protein